MGLEVFEQDRGRRTCRETRGGRAGGEGRNTERKGGGREAKAGGETEWEQVVRDMLFAPAHSTGRPSCDEEGVLHMMPFVAATYIIVSKLPNKFQCFLSGKPAFHVCTHRPWTRAQEFLA